MKNQPEIRLDGFEGEWEDVQFSELVDRVSNRADNSFDLPRVEYEDIISGKGTLRSDFFDKQSSKDGILFEPGDVLYGKLRPYLKNWILADFDGIAVGDFWVLRGVKVTPTFLFQLIQSERFAGLAKMTTGTKMPRADWSVMGSATYEVPTNPEEQKAIGNFFADLDTTITESTTKIEKLKNLRATMLVKMFPQGSSKVPEIRLNGFKGFWVDGTLGDSFDDLGYGLNAPAKSFDGRTKYLRITDIDDDSREFLTSDLTSPDADESVIDSYLLNDQELLIARTGNSVGKTHLFNKKSGRTVFAGFLMRAKIKKSYCPEFVFRLTLTKDFASYVRSVSQRSGQPGMNSAELRECPVIYPEALDEQLAIGTFFRELDELIDAEELKLTKLSNLKNTFLTKMFV